MTSDEWNSKISIAFSFPRRRRASKKESAICVRGEKRESKKIAMDRLRIPGAYPRLRSQSPRSKPAKGPRSTEACINYSVPKSNLIQLAHICKIPYAHALKYVIRYSVNPGRISNAGRTFDEEPLFFPFPRTEGRRSEISSIRSIICRTYFSVKSNEKSTYEKNS